MKESKIKFEIRTKLGMTITKFCETYNVSRGTVSQWANKKRPVSAKYVRLLRELGISQDAIENPGSIQIIH